MRRSLYKSFLVVLTLLLAFTLPSKAQANEQVYEVGIFHLPPWGEPDEDGKIKGVIYEFFELISAESGLKFNYRLIPYARMIKDIGRGKIDFAIFLERPENEKGHTRITTTTYEEIVVYCSHTDPHATWFDIKDVVMAVPLGVNFGDKFEQNTNIKKHFIRDFETSIDLFMSNRVDSFIGPKSALSHNFRRMGISMRDLPRPITVDIQEAFIHAPTHKLTDLPIERIKKAVDRVRKAGRLHNILIKYYGVEGITYAPLPALLNYSDEVSYAGS